MMLITIISPASAVKVFAENPSKTIHIVEVTDFHGTLLDSSGNQVGAVLSNRIKAVKAANPDNTILLSGGDLYQGSALSNINKGVPVAQVFSDIGLDATALGNHEFDWGLDSLKNVTMKDAAYPVICANLYDSTGKRVFEPYKIIDKDGVKVAVIGAITNETPSIVMPEFIKNYTFKDMASEVNTVAAEIRANNLADVIVLLAHEGSTALESVVGNLSGIDAVLGGHAHIITDKVLQDKNGKNIPVVAANYNGKGYIDLTMNVNADKSLSFSASGTNYKALDNADGYKIDSPVIDPAAKKIIDDANAAIAPIVNEIIGVNNDSTLSRTQLTNGNGSYGESYLGNWAADVNKNSAGAQVGLTNNGGLRCDIPSGNITVGSMWQFMPFDNLIYKVPMKKSDLKSILEQAVMDGGKGIQVSGIKFSYDPYKDNLNRVYNLTWEDGSAISDDETITVAAPDFLATGGDGFTAFKDAGGANTSNNTFVLVRDALINNIKTNKAIKTVMDKRINTPEAVTVLATSDIHGNIYNYDYASGKAPSTSQGLAKVSSFVKEVRDYNSNVILADDGDLIQGTPLVYFYNMLDKTTAYPMTKVMAAMKYDTWTLGNHEFNYGLTTLNRIINEAKAGGITVLSANTYNSANQNFVKPYYTKTFTVNGKTVTVGILGLTTKTIPSWENPSNYQGLHFNDLVEEAKKWVPEVRKAGADYVIVTAHSGEEGAADTIPENQIKAIAQNVSGIDAIVAGHAHNLYTDLTLKNPDGKVVPVIEPGKYAQNVSRININYGSDGTFKGITASNVSMNGYSEDSEITTLAQPYQDQTIKYVQTKLGTSTAEFTGEGQTVKATPIMELINKVQMESAGTQLSIAAPLSEAAYIPKGDVTIQNVMSVYVYENFLYGVKMTGKQIKQWLEYSVRYYNQVKASTDPVAQDSVLQIKSYNLDQLYGAAYTIDLTQPACTVDLKTGQVVSGSRIKNLKYKGTLVKDTDVFTVAINNYRYNGGGGFMKAAGLSSTDPSIVTYDSAKALGDDGQVRSLMMAYIKKMGTISPVCSNNWTVSTVAVTQEQPLTNNTNKLVEAIKNASDGDVLKVDISNNPVISKDVFNAIVNKDVTVVFELDGVTWTFYGKNITKEFAANIDLSLVSVPDSITEKEAELIKSKTGKEESLVSFAFKYTGPLPGTATVKVYINKAWAGKEVTICRYFEDKNTYETVAKVIVDKDGYVTFNTDHCSNYFATLAVNLPKTGSPIDMLSMMVFGAATALVGALFIILEDKKKKKTA